MNSTTTGQASAAKLMIGQAAPQPVARNETSKIENFMMRLLEDHVVAIENPDSMVA
jgi:hypothetical protein